MSKVTAEIIAITERIRSEASDLLLDAIDVAERFGHVNQRYRILVGQVVELVGDDVNRFAELLDATGTDTVFKVLDRCKAGE